LHSYLPLWLLALPWLGAILVTALGKGRYTLTRRVALGAVLLSATALAISMQSGVNLPEPISIPWIPEAGIDLALGLDSLSLPFVINVLGVTAVAIWYAWGYLRDALRPHLCYALMLAFSGSMLGTLLARDLVVFFVFWEGMLVTSALLLGGWGEGDRVGAVTLKYFLYTQAGSLLILLGIAWLVAVTGSSSMDAVALAAATLDPTAATWVGGLMIVGFALKMAIFPLHTWLPDAHSIAPMPVTIMLAAAMLGMGAYGILRIPMGLLGTQVITDLQVPLMLFALVSEVHGALMSLASRDIKRIVAYSSVSQMGYVLFAIATLTSKGVAGGIFHVVNHGILKAALFMGTGIVIRGTERRRIDDIGQLAHLMPATCGGIAIAALAISGLPPLCAFHSEWLLFSGGIASDYPLLGYLQFAAPVLTAAYAIWYAIRLALGSPSSPLRVRPTPSAMRWSFYATVLAALVVGLYPAPAYQWVFRAAEQIIGVAWR